MRILKTEEEKGFITILIIYNLVVPNITNNDGKVGFLSLWDRKGK